MAASNCACGRRTRPGFFRAAALKRLDLTSYILSAVLPKADADIAEAERLVLSERDSLRVLTLLETPPPPSGKLVRAAKAGIRLP
jgi:uncharacterized protein (DUF1778 family)